MQMIVVRDKDGVIKARIDPNAHNRQTRVEQAVKDCGAGGGAVNIEEVPDGVDLLGMIPRF